MNTNYKKILDIHDIINEIDDVDLLVEEGDKQEEQENYENAIICHEKAIKLDPKWISPWLSKGRVYHKLKEYEKSITCYDKANQLLTYGSSATDFFKMTFDEIWRCKGLVYSHWGKPYEADECFAKASAHSSS